MKTPIRLMAMILAVALVAVACGDDADSTTTTAAAAPTMDIVDTAVADGRFTTLVAAVQAADLVDTLKSEGPFTVFAPTDDAFAAALEALGLTADELLADEGLADILLYHVVPGAVYAADVAGLTSATTAQGSDIAISSDDGVVLNGSANVIITDIETTNGVIHVIDAVILPPAG